VLVLVLPSKNIVLSFKNWSSLRLIMLLYMLHVILEFNKIFIVNNYFFQEESDGDDFNPGEGDDDDEDEEDEEDDEDSEEEAGGNVSSLFVFTH